MKNFAKIFSVLVLALSIFLVMPKTEVYAAAAPDISQFEIIGMTDLDGFINDEYYPFPGNEVETDGAIYIKIKQMGYGHRTSLLDGVVNNFQEVKTEYIIQNNLVVGFYVVYKIDNLTIGMHDIKFTCIGTNFPNTIISDHAIVNKI
jgi:hypothetical protein